MAKRVSGYIRVSSMTQTDGSSLDVQKAQIEAYCALKGFELVNVYCDAAVSGGKPISGRPEGSKLMASIENGEIQAMIICKLDRGFRNTIDCLQTVDALDKLNVALHIVDMGGSSVDSQSPMGRFMLTVLAAAAELERGQIRQRCESGRNQHKAENKRVGEIPFGYELDSDGETLVEVPREQEALQIMRTLKAQGQTVRQIAHELNSRGFTTKKGKEWTAGTTWNILKVAA